MSNGIDLNRLLIVSPIALSIGVFFVIFKVSKKLKEEGGKHNNDDKI